MAQKDWFSLIKSAEKIALVGSSTRKIHYKFNDGREMVEEYNLDTGVLNKRAWKKNNICKNDKWDVEVGEPFYLNKQENIESIGIKESNDSPFVVHRVTKTKLEWRIRNTPFPIDNYKVSVDSTEKCITIRTVNKKFFKKLPLLELQRLNLTPNQSSLHYSHFMNTLIITYDKPPELLSFEKKLAMELKNVKVIDDTDMNCKPS